MAKHKTKEPAKAQEPVVEEEPVQGREQEKQQSGAGGSGETEPGEHGRGKHKPGVHPHEKGDASSERFAELEQELAAIADRHLRLQAEFDNFRKRTLKEKADLIRSGGESVLARILPVIDDFERALTALQTLPDSDPSKTGIILIYNKFKDFLTQHNVKEIGALGQEFNLDLHFALTKIPAATEEMKGKIVEVVEKGYMLNDKVLRYAKVIIGE